MKIEVMSNVGYKGHSLNDKGSVDFTLVFSYIDLVNTIKMTQMLNNDVVIVAKLSTLPKALKLGMFRIKSISINGDGEATVKFNSLNDFVEVDNLNAIVTKDIFKAKFTADVEREEEDDE